MAAISSSSRSNITGSSESANGAVGGKTRLSRHEKGKIFLPSDVWSHVLPFCNIRDAARLSSVSKFLKRSVLDSESEVWENSRGAHPVIKTIKASSNFFSKGARFDGSDHPHLMDRYMGLANRINRFLGSSPSFPLGSRISSIKQTGQEFKESLLNLKRPQFRNQFYSLESDKKLDLNCSLKQFGNEIEKMMSKKVESGTWEAFFLAAILNEDIGLIEEFPPEYLNREIADLGAYLCLMNDRIDLCRKILRSTSIFKEEPKMAGRYFLLQRIDSSTLSSRFSNLYSLPFDPFPSRGVELLNHLIVLAAEKGKVDLFSEFIKLKKPFCQNRVLVHLAQMQDQQKTLKILLNSGLKFSQTLTEPSSCFDEGLSHPGLHAALMFAFNQNRVSNINAILEALPGKKISHEILEDVRALFEDQELSEENSSQAILDEARRPNAARRYRKYADHLEVNQRMRSDPEEIPHSFMNPWSLRENHPNRAALIGRLTDELQQRYPELDFPLIDDLIHSGRIEEKKVQPNERRGEAVAEELGLLPQVPEDRFQRPRLIDFFLSWLSGPPPEWF